MRSETSSGNPRGELIPNFIGGAWSPAGAAESLDVVDPAAGMRLARECRAPRATAWVVVSVNRVPDAWKPYLALAS